MGDSDIRGADTVRTPSNIFGATCDYANGAALDDTQKFHVGAVMCKLTNILSDGRRIQALQSQRKGKRHYIGRLDKVGSTGLPLQIPPQKRSRSPNLSLVACHQKGPKRN